MRLIVDKELNAGAGGAEDASYNDQRRLIGSVFGQGNGACGKGEIIKRLVVIDSLYSTDAAYSYFSFDEMADAIRGLESEGGAQGYFYDVACGAVDHKNVFGKQYGIRKGLENGSRQMSLLSKYAYYSLMQDKERYPLGFPIYDSLAKASYPVVWRMLTGKEPSVVLPRQGTPPIGAYVKCLNDLRKELFEDNELFMGYQQFDILDAYLWRMGKFGAGNLSLLLNRKDYTRFIQNTLEFDDTGVRKPYYIDQGASKKVREKEVFDFDKAVVMEMIRKKEAVFSGLGCEPYMVRLFKHWMEFYTDKQ